ncbi:GDSL-type esterase/lipase family protein [Streptomyces sp. NPDC102441]|uniref:GDSL-type esterase/lipase family protein n=1 Tax=Streptomyces sp. NPDC102441 TaxID=3366176 RepID=UPI003812BCFB
MRYLGRITTALLSVLLISMGVTAPAEAHPDDLAGLNFATWNLQGATLQGESKWTDGVQRVVLGSANNGVGAHNVVALQEAGSPPAQPTGAPAPQAVAHRTINGQLYEVFHSLWDTRGVRLHVYHMQTDVNGNRVNLSIVADREPDAVYIAPGSDSINRSRPSFGIRIGTNIFWTVHALSGNGNDGRAYIQNFHDQAGSNYSWMALGDWNRTPEDQLPIIPRGGDNNLRIAYIESTGQATHVTGRELDYGIGSIDLAAGMTAQLLPNLAGSDHWPVEFTPLPDLPEDGEEVRLAPVGDSLTSGEGATDGNGFRDELFDGLEFMGLEPDFFGQNSSGNMPDPQHDGYNGYGIGDISGVVERDISESKPHIITLWAGADDAQKVLRGTNAIGARSAADTGTEMADDLDELIDTLQAKAPDAAIAVATVPMRGDSATEEFRDAFNAKVRSLMNGRQHRGERIELVEAGSLPEDMMHDDFHPNDLGYEFVAQRFFQAVMGAEAKGWAGTPGNPGTGNPDDPGNPGTGGPGPGNPGTGPSQPDIRLMSAGDSITYGVGSSDGNGYRKQLYDDLEAAQLHPDFVGSNASGSMSDPQHDGNRGWVIDQIAEPAVQDAASMRPNVMTLMAGTNDVYYQKGGAVADAPARLGRLIDRVQKGSPGISIVVATLVPVKNDPSAMQRRNAYNEAVRALVKDRQAEGQKIMLADFGPMSEDMLHDTLHPNDRGYTYMAERWFEAITAMVDKRWVIQPANAPHLPDACQVQPGGGWAELGRIAQGPINSDSASAGVKGDVHLADFDGDGRADYSIVTDTGALYLWTRTSAGGWVNRGKVANGNGVKGRGAQVRFADVNGDHDDDYLVVHEDGSVQAFLNNDVPVNGNQGWQSIGVIAAGTGDEGDQVRFADIDGDAYDDYLVVHDNGSLEAWVNNDVAVKGKSAWKKLGQVAEGTGNPGSKVRLADLDGDKDADYLIVHSNGATEAWLNNDVAVKAAGKWKSIGKIATGTGIDGTVQFAEANADGDADYFVVGSAGTATWWANDKVATRNDKENGFKKKGVYGDHKLDAANNARTVDFADLDGDGDDDYILVGPKGEIEAWRNDDVATRGTNAWIKVGRVAEGVSPGKKQRVVFADFNGDGRDDYLVVDDTNGRVRGWRNDGVFTKGVTAWTNLGVIARGPTLAAEGHVQFADIDGDGRDDYLVVTSGHSAHAWKNKGTDAPGGGGWGLKTLIASPKDPITATQTTLFANINCDRRADYVLRDSAQHNALYGWRNLGGFTNEWSGKKKIAFGVAMSFPVDNHLADLNGDGLDDYLVVDPRNGATRAWLNKGGNQATP